MKQLYGVRLAPFYIWISTKGENETVKRTQLATLAPYEVFAEIFRLKVHQKSLLGKCSEADVLQYWQLLSRGFRHHIMDIADFPLEKTVPIFVHSDGGDIYKHREYSITSWSSALCEDINTYDVRFLICALVQDDKIPEITDQEIVEYIVWNLEVIESGHHPYRDHVGQQLTGARARKAGTPLAEEGCCSKHRSITGAITCHLFSSLGGLRYVAKIHLGDWTLAEAPSSLICFRVWQGTGDTAYVLIFTITILGYRGAGVGTQGDTVEKVKLHRFTRNFQANYPCERCLGNRYSLDGSAYNFATDAMWKLLRVSDASYRASAVNPSPWTRYRSWQVSRHRDDLTHMLWLGVGKDVGGQILYDLAIVGGQAELGQRMRTLHADMLRWFAARNVRCGVPRFSKSTVTASSANEYPVLESKLKAIQTKMIFIWCSWLAVDIANREGADDYAKLRATMAWSLSAFVATLDHAGLFLNDQEAQAASKHGAVFLQTYQTLAARSMELGICAWRVAFDKCEVCTFLAASSPTPRLRAVSHKPGRSLLTARNNFMIGLPA